MSETVEPKKRERSRGLHRRQRLDAVEMMLRRGYTNSSIEGMLSAEWKCGRIAVKKMIREVYDEWEADAKKYGVDRVFQRRQQLEGVLEAAMIDKDWRAAVVALDRLCKIDGCYAAVQFEMNITGSLEHRLSMMTSDQKRQRFDELRAAYDRNKGQNLLERVVKVANQG